MSIPRRSGSSRTANMLADDTPRASGRGPSNRRDLDGFGHPGVAQISRKPDSAVKKVSKIDGAIIVHRDSHPNQEAPAAARATKHIIRQRIAGETPTNLPPKSATRRSNGAPSRSQDAELVYAVIMTPVVMHAPTTAERSTRSTRPVIAPLTRTIADAQPDIQAAIPELQPQPQHREDVDPYSPTGSITSEMSEWDSPTIWC